MRYSTVSASMLSPHASTISFNCVNTRSAAALEGWTRTTKRNAFFHAGIVLQRTIHHFQVRRARSGAARDPAAAAHLIKHSTV
eukprot:COSAG06_NODE_1939_length_8024_cov_83.073186_5_plen_83_part_00